MNYRKFANDIAIYGLTQASVALRGLIILPIITKMLGARDYGVWSQLMTTMGLSVFIINLGLSYTLVRFLAAEKNRKEIQEGVYSVIGLMLGLTSLMILIFFAFANPIANFLGADPALIKILAFIIQFECLDLILLSALRAFGHIGKCSVFMASQAFGEVALTIITILAGWGIWGAVLSVLAVRIIIFAILFGIIFAKIGIKRPNFSRIKEYLGFGIPVLLSSISYWVVESSDRYLIGFFLGVTYVGYYSPAYILGTIISFLIGPFAFVLPVVLSKFFDENKIEDVKDYLKNSLKYYLLLAIPSVFGLSMLAKPLLAILTTPQIAEQSYYITPFIVLSTLIYGIYNFFVNILTLTKKIAVVGLVWLGAAVVNLALNLVFIPYLGILGAALTTLIAYSLVLAVIWNYSFSQFKFGIDWKFIFKSILASTVMSVFLAYINPTGLAPNLGAIFAGAMIYGIMIVLLKGFNKKEINFAKELLGGIGHTRNR